MNLTYALFVPGLAFNGNSFKEKSIGGSESAAYYMARELRRIGDNRVVVFSNTPAEGEFDGVGYRTIDKYPMFAQMHPHDVSIVQRHPPALATRIASKLNVLWQHDLPARRDAATFRGILWNIDLVAVLSSFHKAQYENTLQLPEKVLWQTRNGIDLAAFKKLRGMPRVPNRIIYGARPERGLDVMLKMIMPRLLMAVPDIELAICTYDNPVDSMRGFYEELRQVAASYGPRVKWLGGLTKDRLYEEYSMARAYVYPTPSPIAPRFSEISCITAMECMAAGLPMVTSNRGALPETLAPGAGTLIDGDPTTPRYQHAFAEAVLHYIRDDIAWNAASNAGIEAAEALDWAPLAHEWHDRFVAEIARKNNDPIRLARWFYKRSEIEGAARAIHEADPEDEQVGEIGAELARHYGFMWDRERMLQHVIKTGEETDRFLKSQPISSFASSFRASREERFSLIERFVAERPDIGSILDYGCGHGWCDVYLHNRLGKRWVGLDVDPKAVEWSRKFAERFASNPSSLRFVQAWESERDADAARMALTEIPLTSNGDAALPAIGEFDMLLCTEALEHVFDPVGVIERMESCVREGGHVFVTVPYGPAEYDEATWHNGARTHVREFDAHDLEDIFGKKRDVQIFAVGTRVQEELGDPIGFFVVHYRKDSERATGRIDWERKLKLQRPRESLSVSIMAGGPNAEDTLKWCLKSVQHIADEIVITNGGLSEEALTTMRAFGARIIDARPPETHPAAVAQRAGLGDDIRTIQRLIRRSDIETARWLIDQAEPSPAIAELKGWLARYFPQLDDQHQYLSLYADAGEIEAKEKGAFDQVPHEQRFGAVMRWLAARPQATRVLDFGSSRGLYAIQLHNRLGREWICMDIDKQSIEEGRKIADDKAADSKAFRFIRAPYDITKLDFPHKMRPNAAMVCEVLEHVPDSALTMTAIENRMDPGSPVLITVPFGPVEFGSWVGNPEKGAEHIREFNETRLRQMFGMKTDFAIERHVIARDNVLGEDIGYFVVTYLSDHIGCADFEPEHVENDEPAGHEIRLRAPTMAALRMLSPLADYIEIVDEGFTPEQREEALALGATIIQSLNPIEVGFEAPRNVGLSHCRSDWVLWIDLDERLIDPSKLTKYLRSNAFDGYSVRQHHFTVDTSFQPDMPVRLFRRRFRNDAKSIRFFGMIHEHPETAINEGAGSSIVISDVNIAHVGYLSESTRRKRFDRNLPRLRADMAKYPDRKLQKHFQMRDWMLIAQWELQQNGGQLTAKIEDVCEQVIATYREHFLGKAHVQNADSLWYYSQALAILGRGVDVAFDIKANRGGYGDAIPPGAGRRFETTEDLLAELKWRGTQAIENFTAEDW